MAWWPANEEELNAPRGSEYDYVREVLDFGWHNTSSPGFCGRLERAFCATFGSAFAISHSNGTATMHTCLMAAGVGPGDEVIVPALTMASTAYVVLQQNAVPVFADVEADTFEISVESIRSLLTPRTKAIITVALYGLSPDMDPIMQLAREHGLAVIEDNAQCYLGRYHGRMVGTLGHMASFSLQGSKHVTCGDGGMVITDDEVLAGKIRRAAILGYSGVSAVPGATTVPRHIRQEPTYERHQELGWNYRLPELCAAAALGQFERVEELVTWRQQVAAGYAEVLAGCDWLIPQRVPEGLVNAYWCYALKLATDELTWQQLRDKVVEVGGEPIYGAWRPVHLEPVFRHQRFYGHGCPTACPLYEGETPVYAEGLCPTVESLQPRLFQLRTNYVRPRAEKQYEALAKAIAFFGG